MRPPLHPKRRRRKLDEPGTHHDVTVSRSFVAPCRAEVVVVKCDLPTYRPYPDGATGDNGPAGKEPEPCLPVLALGTWDKKCFASLFFSLAAAC